VRASCTRSDGFGRFPSPYNVGGFGDEQLAASSDGVSMLSRDSAASTHPLPRGTTLLNDMKKAERA